MGLAVGRALIYATGGVAFAEFDATLQVGANRPTDSETAVGGTVGGGVEFAITDMVSAFVEGRYTVMGSDSFTGGGVVSRSYEIHYGQVVGGVSFKLGNLLGGN